MVLSEEILKIKYRKEPFSVFEVEKGTVLTPSARQFLNDKGIELITNDEKKILKEEQAEINKPQEEIFETPKYRGRNGEYYFEKPDYMTQVEGNILVLKSSQEIVFSSKIEVFLSELLLLEKEMEIQASNEKLQKDMSTIVKFVNNILSAFNFDKILENQFLFEGKSLKEIIEISREPKKMFKKGHIIELTVKNDILVHKLNRLKALARELETYAVSFFVSPIEIKRKDLLEAFNVLSSALYIMMLKLENQQY